MPFSYDMQLPTEEELTIPEINMSMAALYAGAFHLGKVCENQNNEFVLCRDELKDPRKCLQEGKEVTKCAFDFFQKIKKECRREFDDFATCLHKSSKNWEYSACRRTQGVFDQCMLDKLGVERPPWGWYSEIHVHNAKRPRPEPEPKEFTDVPDKFNPDEPKKPAKYGIRSPF